MKHVQLLTTFVALSLTLTARAAEFHLDPSSGKMSNNGSSSQPWSTIEQVVAEAKFGTTVQAGDTLFLRSGYHGELDLNGGNYGAPVTIAAEPGHTPRLRRVRLNGTTGIIVQGLSISASHAPSYAKATLVEVVGDSSRVTIENCQVFSVDDASGWGANEWINDACNGMRIDGNEVTVKANTVRNVRFAISVNADNVLVERNTIDGFSADGIRGLGDFGVYQYNVIKNVYVESDLDKNHDDGFQSWSVGPNGVGTGEVRGVVLRGNLILNYEDHNQPLRSTVQGIGCFDGTFVDWVVENNVVITDHWHGISLYGARNCRIVNNTVLDINDQKPGPPWISMHEHKDGTPPQNCVVRNNLATDYANAESGVIEDHNTIIDDPESLFVNPTDHDLHLLPNASVIDQGSPELAPELDADGIQRPQGNGIDPGAFEWHDPGVKRAEAGVGAESGPGAKAGVDSGTVSDGVPDANPGVDSGAVSDNGATVTGAGGSVIVGSGTSTDDDGCSCRVAPRTAPSTALVPSSTWALALATLALLWRRVRRRTFTT